MKKQFAMLLMLTLTAFSTAWSQDSTKVAYSDLKEILILASKGEQVDSLVYHYELQLEIKDSKIEIREDELLLAKELIEKQAAVISDQSAKIAHLERRNKNIRRACFSFIGISILEAVIIFKK